MKWSINDALFFSLIHQPQPQFWHFLSFFCASFPSTIAVGGISQPVLNHFFNIGSVACAQNLFSPQSL